MNADVVKNVISKLGKKFRKMTVNFGQVCDFISIKIRFLKNKMLEVDMRSYLKEATDDFSEEDLRPVKTLAKLSLFDLDMNSLLVSEENRVKFHSIMIKLMHMSYRARKDMQLTATFLASRVNCCTIQDYSKFRRLISYIIGLMDSLIYLRIDDTGKMVHFIDASFTHRIDFKSKTNGYSTFGTGIFSSDSNK